MAMPARTEAAEAVIPITGRRLTLPAGPIFCLQRAHEAEYEIGEFRAWAGYRNLGADAATDDLVHFQHVISFAGTLDSGRTGIHAHFAHGHIVIPTSGRGVFSYDGVITEAAPGSVIVQHGGTVHDQFDYSYVAQSDAENRRTPQTIDPVPHDAPPRSFSFLELFVPKTFANVEIVPPEAVTEADQAAAWDHPYHAKGARFFMQGPTAAGAAWRPVAGREDLEARDAETWGPSGGLVATWFVRPAAPLTKGRPVTLGIAGESGGLDIRYMVTGSAKFARADGEEFVLGAGDALTCSQGLVGDAFACSPDMRMVRFFIAARAQDLRERTPEEIAALEALGPRIVTRREVRPTGDTRPVNFLHEEGR
jgi:mannose-6-phosphate isomerase-like protein (cupin superfamily)